MLRPVFVLAVICLVASTLLGIVNQITIAPIAEAQQQLKTQALGDIFPFAVENVTTAKTGGATYYEVRSGAGELKGIGIETFTEQGYSGRIDILLALSPEGKIFYYKVLSTKETPGLGIKIADGEYRKQFHGKGLSDGFAWKVKKDGGDVDAVTAATISSRAIVDAIHRGLERYKDRYGATSPSPAKGAVKGVDAVTAATASSFSTPNSADQGKAAARKLQFLG